MSEEDLSEGGHVSKEASQGVAGDLGEGVVGGSEDSERSEVADGLLGKPGSLDCSHEGGEPGVRGQGVEHVLGGSAAAVATMRGGVSNIISVEEIGYR